MTPPQKKNFFYFFAVGAVVCGPAWGYVRSQNSGQMDIWWSSRGHPFIIDGQGTPDVPGLAAFTAIRQSFQTWSKIDCSDLTFPDEGLSMDPKDRVVGFFSGRENHNLVLFRTRRCGDGKDGGVVPPGDPCLTQGGCANLYDCWDHGDGVIATTTTTSNRFTGQIHDSDIELNDAPDVSGAKFTFTALDGPPCTDVNQTGCVEIDVQNTVTHEAGHTLGLDHTPDPGAAMYAFAPEGETSKRVLGADDVNGICAIYPRGGPTLIGRTVGLTPVAASNGGCGSTGTQAGPGAVLGVLALLLRRWRQFHPRC